MRPPRSECERIATYQNLGPLPRRSPAHPIPPAEMNNCMSFEEFDLDPRCLHVLNQQSITEPTPVQDQAIPIALEGKDLVAVAQTGTGKTLAFALPSLTRLAQGKIKRNLMLVLLPTRELCTQVHEVIDTLGKAMHINAVPIYGGVSIDKQANQLRKGMTVIVATPGRLLDQMGRKNVRFDNLEILVLDEADRMLDMGFLPDIQRILRKLPPDRQTLMFSATFPNEISRMAEKMMREPERVSVGAIAKPVDTVRQTLYSVRAEDKTALLTKIMDEEDITSALIFLRTKSRTERLASTLRKKKYNIAQIHGDRSQGQRQQALDGFKNGKYNVLVATDVASRGLDIDCVSHAFNYDIPPNSDDYIHRIGRTARAQADGDAITFVSPTEYKELESIERALAHNIPRAEWEKAPRVLSLYHPPGKKKAGNRQRRPRPAPRRRRRLL